MDTSLFFQILKYILSIIGILIWIVGMYLYVFKVVPKYLKLLISDFDVTNTMFIMLLIVHVISIPFLVIFANWGINIWVTTTCFIILFVSIITMIILFIRLFKCMVKLFFKLGKAIIYMIRSDIENIGLRLKLKNYKFFNKNKFNTVNYKNNREFEIGQILDNLNIKK